MTGSGRARRIRRHRPLTAPYLKVAASGFHMTFARKNGIHLLQVSKHRCLHAAVTIGLQQFHAAAPASAHAVALALYKALAMKCAVDFTQANLMRPSEYEAMDPSEKGNISFWVGMTFSGIIASDILQVSRLLHAAAFYRAGLVRVNPGSRRLADFVGQDANDDWHVIESKARQQNPSARLRDNWKEQATTISFVDGCSPVTHSYVLAKIDQTYTAEIVDPEPDDETQHTKIEFEEGAVLQVYYGSLLSWLKEQGKPVEWGQQKLILALAGYDSVEGKAVYLGLTEDTYRAGISGKILKTGEAVETEDMYVGADGVVVVTSNKCAELSRRWLRRFEKGSF